MTLGGSDSPTQGSPYVSEGDKLKAERIAAYSRNFNRIKKDIRSGNRRLLKQGKLSVNVRCVIEKPIRKN